MGFQILTDSSRRRSIQSYHLKKQKNNHKANDVGTNLK